MTNAELRAEYLKSIESRCADVVALRAANDKGAEEAYLNAHDHAEFVGDFLANLNVVTAEDVDNAIAKVEELER